jgi:hypothetical protein
MKTKIMNQKLNKSRCKNNVIIFDYSIVKNEIIQYICFAIRCERKNTISNIIVAKIMLNTKKCKKDEHVKM